MTNNTNNNQNKENHLNCNNNIKFLKLFMISKNTIQIAQYNKTMKYLMY